MSAVFALVAANRYAFFLLPLQLVQDWRAFRARLVAMETGHTARAVSLQLGREERWAHVLAQPERGCLLVARPRPGLGMFTNTGGCSRGCASGRRASSVPTVQTLPHLSPNFHSAQGASEGGGK